MPRRTQPTIRLYSASPRRRELMEQAALPFVVRPVEADESIPPGLSSAEVVRTIALRKLHSGLESDRDDTGGFWALAADTLVEGPSGLLGKPENVDEARGMLRSLSGTAHTVFSAIAMAAPTESGTPPIRTDVHRTKVLFRQLTNAEIDRYADTGEWSGAAGAYRIQGRGELLVERIEGLWSTVVGLPLGPLYGMLSGLSYPFG